METNGLMLNVGPNCLCIVLTLRGIAVLLHVITVIPTWEKGAVVRPKKYQYNC
jgi:hypothetical protein